MIIKKVTITKLAQFLTVGSGGKLIQHVEGHRNCVDNITISENFSSNRTIEIPSDHHQMMYPYNLPKDSYEIIGHSTYFKSDTYLNGDNENIELPNDFLEAEIVFYQKTNSLAIQSHPEWISDLNNKSLNYIYQIIRQTILKNFKQ